MSDTMQELVAALKRFVELSNFLCGPRPDIPYQSAQDEEFLRAEAMLARFGETVEWAYEPQRVLDTRHPEWGHNKSIPAVTESP